MTTFDATSGDWTVSIGTNSYVIELTDDNGKTLVDINEVLLPLELLTFTGTTETRSNQLFWTTASEENTAYFEVEKSSNGIDFTTIGRVQAENNATNNYNFEDKDLRPVSYYRLKIVEHDKSYDYSNIIQLRRKLDDAEGIQILYPNPAKETIQVIARTNGQASLQMEIVDELGRILKTINTNSNPAGMYSQEIDISDLPAGVYYLKMMNGKMFNVASFVKL